MDGALTVIINLFFTFNFSVSAESIIDVEGVIEKVDKKIQSCSQQDVELHVKQVKYLYHGGKLMINKRIFHSFLSGFLKHIKVWHYMG